MDVNTNPNKRINALETFIAKKAEFDEMLENMQKMSDDHFYKQPYSIDWGDVGDLSYYCETLQLVHDRMLKLGEFAE